MIYKIVVAGEALQYEIAAQIFLATIREVRQQSDFATITLSEQNVVLSKGWAALFLLRAATWPLTLSETLVNRKCGLICLATVRETIKQLHPDKIELQALEVILLCRRGDHITQ